MRARTLAISFLLTWWMGIFAPPLIKHWGGDPSGIYSVYSHVCHQREDRSFHIFGTKMGVCSRCTGIYTGMLFFVMTSSLLPIPLSGTTAALFLSPLAGGKLLEEITGYSSNWERFITGFFPGVLLGMGLLYGLRDLKGEK